ncbi:MmgE/PrpD family protein [Nonomuraea zeae]|uniref:MmgE/PrpD family protein n=1 Tax=Nonomuraea zeae TaxID=1642303 RepID=UPI0014785C4E|nr:MmgE/PrpD family protein [Nonomuraea zeae]
MSGSAHAIDTAVRVASELDLAHVPEPTLRRALLVIADTVAVATAGARTPEIAALVALDEHDALVTPVDRAGAGHTATVLTTPHRRAHPAHAAFINATAGTSLELDEGMRPTGHPGMHVIPAALAVAERAHATGADLVRAVLAGYEVSSRLFRAFRLRQGVHPHGHIGAVGAAVAVALLDGTDPVTAAEIAATSPLLSVWQSCYDGATARNAYTGHAAQSGVRASALARAGFTGSAGALEVAFGQVAGELADEAALTAPLRYDDLGITRNYFKVHSACALSHSAVEAGLALAPVRPEEIREVLVETVSVNLKIDRQPVANDLSGRFSLQYAVATALVLGRSDVEAFRFRPEIAAVAEKVRVSVLPEFEAEWPDSAPARVTVVTGGGSAAETVRNPRGHHTRPLTEAEHQEKFAALVGDRRTAAAWWERLGGLLTVSDCASLLEADPDGAGPSGGAP